MALVALIATIAVPADRAEAATHHWGRAGVSTTYSRWETGRIAGLSDNAAWGYALIALAAAGGRWGAAVAGSYYMINDMARSARDSGQCLSMYKPYVTSVFWPRIVPCVS